MLHQVSPKFGYTPFDDINGRFRRRDVVSLFVSAISVFSQGNGTRRSKTFFQSSGQGTGSTPPG